MSGWDDIPTGDQLADASLELEAFRDSVQESQKYSRGRDPHAALVMSKRDEGVRVVDSLVTALKKRPAREFAPGDTLRTVSDRIEHLSQVNPELLGRLQKKPVAPRPKKKPFIPLPPGVITGFGGSPISSIDANIVSSIDANIVSEIDPNIVSSIDANIVGLTSAFSPVPKERWGKSPRSPNGLIDAMSKVSLLELWKDRPIEEVEKAILELEKQDRFSASAIADGAPFFKPDPREVRRIINSEWNIDLSYAGHDFALPGQQKKSPALNATQSRLLEVVTAVATRSAALGRNDESPLDLRSPFGFNRAPGTVLQSPGLLSAAISNGNWALGIHGDRTSFVEALQGIIAPERDTWLNDQFRFAEAILSPSQRDRMGEHRTPLKMSLGPTRTMLAIRQRLAEAPEMTAFVDPEGQIALMGKVDNSDPFWDRAMLTPQWDKRREEILMDAVAKYPHALAFLGDRPVSGSYFDPYTQQVESFRTEWMVSKKDPKKEATLGKVEVDHVVALKYAWDHGFREMYLGAVGDPVRLRRVVALMQEFGLGRGRFQDELALVNRAANQEKSDKGPDRFMPFPVAKTMREHQANAFYVATHRKLIQSLRTAGTELQGFNPNFMATSLSERRAMERIDRGWDLGSDTMLGRGLNFGRNAILENFILPDLSEDASYLQTRESLALMWFNAFTGTATWRYVPKNALYLLGRPIVTTAANKFLSLFNGKEYHLPEMYREMIRSKRLEVEGVRNWFYEASRQGTQTEIFSKTDGGLYSRAKNRISVPTLRQAYNYARGEASAFGPVRTGEFHRPESWRLAGHEDMEPRFRQYVEEFISTGDQAMLDQKKLSGIFLDSPADAYRLQSLSVRDLLPGSELPNRFADRISRALRSKFSNRFTHEFIQSTLSVSGREALNATPFLVDLWRAGQRGRTLGGLAGIRLGAAGVAHASFVESAVKAIDIGATAAFFGRNPGAAISGYAHLGLPILGIETAYGLLAQAADQRIYVSPSMGKTTLLGHDLLRPHKMRFWGGLDRVEEIRSQLIAQKAESAARAKAAALRRDAALQSLATHGRSMDRLRADYARDLADALSNPSSSLVDSRRLDAAIESNLAFFEELDQQAALARRDRTQALWDLRRTNRSLNAIASGPEALTEGLKATGLRRFWLDLQVSNPHTTMFAGRMLNAPGSFVDNLYRTTKFYGGGVASKLRAARSGQFGGTVKGGARALNVVGHGLNVYGAVESWSRYRSATDLMERSGDRGFGGLSDEERHDVASYAEQSVGDLLVDLGFSMATLDPLATATGGFNAYQRSKVQRHLIAQQGEYRSMAGSAALRGGASVSATYAYKRQLSVLADMGYIPGVGDSLVQAENDRRFREVQAAQQASLAQARRKEAAARTERERSSVKKHLNQILTAGRLMVDMPEAREGGEDVADSLLNPFTGPKSRYAAKTYPMRTSIPFRMSEDPRRAYEADSVNFFGRRGQSDALAFDPVAHSKWQRSSMVAAIGDNNRLLIDSLATGSTPGLRGFSSRTTVQRIGHAIVDQRIRERRDSIMADTRISIAERRDSVASSMARSPGVNIVNSPSILSPIDWLVKKTGLAPLRDWERRELEADTLQAAQRRGK